MRPSRMLLLVLAGVVAVHVVMLAAHGSGNSVAAGIGSATGHAASAPSRSAPMPDDQRHTAIDLTVACLAVLAGLVLLGPRRAAQAATAHQDRPVPSWAPASLGRAGPRRRSLAELCISLT